MKKILLALTVCAFSFALSAQERVNNAKNVSGIIRKTELTGNEKGAVPTQTASPLRTLNRNFMGSSFYDVPSNGSMSNRVVAHNDGTISAVWTAMTSNINSRGTGYNYYDNSNWINGNTTAARIENTRAGWGTITSVGDAEIVVSHNGVDALVISISQKGSNEWTYSTLQGPALTNGTNTSTCLLWPAIASSGNTIHLIACTESDAGYLFNGIQTCLIYYRGTFDASTNTITWEDPRVVGDVTADEVSRFAGDTYAITAKDNTVAIIANPGVRCPVFLWKSTDNGVNFTKTDIIAPQYVAGDTVYEIDGSVAVSIDDNGSVHTAFGAYLAYHETDTSSTYTWYPGVGYLLYWNESMNPIQNNGNNHFMDPEALTNNGYYIVERFNLDCDTSIWSVSGWGVNAYPNYGVGVVSMPQLVAQNGNVYLVFCQLLEYPFADFNYNKYYRGVFGVKSTDNGQTFGDYSWLSYNKDCFYLSSWESFPINDSTTTGQILDNVENSNENVFPAVAQTIVNGNISMIWMNDMKAGSDIKDDEVSMSENENYMYFLQMTADSIGIYNNTKEVCQGLWIDKTGINNQVISGMKIYPNPATNSVNVTFSSENSDNAVVSVMNIMGQTIISENHDIKEGYNYINLNINSLRSGVYMINIKTKQGTSTQKLIVK